LEDLDVNDTILKMDQEIAPVVIELADLDEGSG
jgi:hypothetical protein